MDQAPARAAEQPEHKLLLGNAMSELEAAIRSLPPRQQQAFLLRCLEGLNVEETAVSMGCSQGSVKSHYSRAVRSLRKALRDHW